MNSQVRDERAIRDSEAGTPLSIESVVFAETMIGHALARENHEDRSKTILLVEDEAFVRNMTAEVLGSAGYRLVIAGSGAEALEACRNRSEPVDLLLADVVMPGMGGRELAAKFESLRPSARVLLMSGYPEQLALCELSIGGKGHMAKPFSVDMLLQRVCEVLDM